MLKNSFISPNLLTFKASFILYIVGPKLIEHLGPIAIMLST